MSGYKWMYMGQIVEDGIYILKDGDLYKCDPRIIFPIAKSVNIVTGKVHYPTNADRIRSMTDEELVDFMYNEKLSPWCTVNKECKPRCRDCFAEWLKEEVSE